MPWRTKIISQYTLDGKWIKDNVKKWSKENPVKILAHTRRQQTKRLMRYPKWITADDRWMIEQAYELAALRTKLFGFQWHVDHVIPLQGKLVSGLHVPHNMQIIPARDNRNKSNRFTTVT
jgi:hypothetical protein